MSAWKELKTADGLEYYHNEDTGETTWDKPAELLSGDEVVSGDWSWIPHPDSGFIIGRVKHEYKDGTRIIEQPNGPDVEVKLTKTDKIFPGVNFASLKRLPHDLVQMENVNDATIQHNLKGRAHKDIIYTSVGDILISINPYKMLPLYTTSVMQEYWEGNREKLPPHPFTIAGDCYRKLFDDKQNQSVIISGESGAGKTEATKVVLQFLAEIAGSSSGVEQRMLSANPILEGFGNAKTIRNNNSSRFGKLMEIFFDPKSRISGCGIINYLLEKSRVTKQAGNERNFHVFYQLIKGASPQQRQRLQLADAEEYDYLNQSGCTDIPGVDDAADLHESMEAMDSLGFSPSDKEGTFDLVAAVLHLGALRFVEDGQGSKVENADILELAANLLQVPTFLLQQELTARQFQGSANRSTTYTIPLTPEQASDGRDALAQTIYGNLFNWLVVKINQSLASVDGDTTARTIGVLDIFGFEIFEKNSFEQLCINFTNEKLQQHFNSHTFKLEEQVYQNEKISFTHVEFIDNQTVLDLIEKRPQGLLILLDEELVVPKGTDETFLKKLNQCHEKNERFRVNRTAKTTFTVIHYAGDVVYDVTNFLDKNKDTIPEGIMGVMESSASVLVKSLFPSSSMASPAASSPAGRGRGRGAAVATPAASGKTNRKASLGSQFREQLNKLMVTLNATEPHYIRCIKPNQNKRPACEDVDGGMILRQLRYAGVFEAVNIRQTGYPFRMTHLEFWKKYRLLAPKAQGSNIKDTCNLLLKEISKQKDMSAVQIGVTKVLYRAFQHRDLELLRNFATEKQAIVVQAGQRGWKSRCLYKRVHAVRVTLRKAIQSRDLNTLNQALSTLHEADFPPKEADDATKLRDLILEEIRVANVLSEVLREIGSQRDLSTNLLERLKTIVSSAEAIGFGSADANTARAVQVEVLARIETRKELEEGTRSNNEQVLTAALAKASQIGLQVNEPVVDAAQKELERIKQENIIIREMKAALSIDGQHPGVSVSSQPGSKGEVSLTKQAISDLQSVISKANSFTLKTEYGRKIDATSRVVENLRQTIIRDDIDAIERLLYDASTKSNDLVESIEIRAARDMINTKASKADVQMKLDEAARIFDADTLAFELEKANVLQMEVDWYTNLYYQITDTQKMLADGIQTVVRERLDEAVAYADTFGYNLSDYESGVRLRDILVGLEGEIDRTLRVLESRDQMQELYDRARGVGMHTEDFDELGRLLDLTEEELTKKQLKAAIILNDRTRIISLNVHLKELFFRQFASTFKMSECASIKTPHEYARGKIFGKDKAKIEMMNWQKNCIHASLTRIDPLQAKDKEAVICFKNLMGYMGDKNINYPQMLAQENIQKGIDQPVIRDEIFVQIIKQLTNNPNPSSVQKGWTMMELCLKHFPPSRTFENYLEIFLRQLGDSKQHYRMWLHEIIFSGPKSSAIPAEQIPFSYVLV
eukprot:TRINITY_DN10891_c0_g1_i2.p1 TRINITY_DN10891_c0_g1~~TRINITY_DN10891_c0_g1_i2.p1  ORF type:complete len:1456 (-),score=681.29 TRINITY_DN10891_c0_g1_i2:96-4436(-)